MATFEEGFEGGFIRINLFVFISLIGFVLLWLVVEDLFRHLVKCQKRQVVSKLRADEMAL